MDRLHFKTAAVFGLFGITGCSSGGAEDPAVQQATTSTATTPTAVPISRIDLNLERLRGLDVFEVGDLVVTLSKNCYGMCPETPGLKAANAGRLDTLTATAEFASVHLNFSYACTENVDTNLETLRALNIVDIGAMLVAIPVNNPSCYNTPCQADVDAAAATNALRAEKLESIALAMKAPSP